MHYGVINEDYLELRFPRVCDETFEHLSNAFDAARGLIQDQEAEQVSIVAAVYSEKHGCFVEAFGGGSITIDARDVHWLQQEEEEE